MTNFSPVEKKPLAERTTSRVIVAVAHGEGTVLLCEPGVALDFVGESGTAASIDGFVPEEAGVDMEPCPTPGIYVGELRIVDDGAESWELPHIRNHRAEIRRLRPIEPEQWKAHLKGEWPEGWYEEQTLPQAG